MPYPRAHLVLLLFVPLTLLAFWPSYFSRLDSVPAAFHMHGATASLWLLMLILQSWLISHRSFAWHRVIGRTSFVLVPLFLAGGLLMLKAMAGNAGAGGNPVMQMYGTRLGVLDVLAVGGFTGLYYGALRNRGSVQRHARYMLATPLLLISPILTRVLLGFAPPLAIRGPEDLPVFGVAVQISNVVALLLALLLYVSAPRYGRAFLVAAGLVALQIVSFQWVGDMPWWRDTYLSLLLVPDAVLLAAGLLIGVGIIGLALAPRGRPGLTPA